MNLPAAPLKPVIGLVVLEPAPVAVPLLPPLLEPEPDEEPEPEPSLPEPPVVLPVPAPVEDARGAVEDPVALPLDVELPVMKTPPAIAGGAVLSLVLAAASLYASRVLGEGGALAGV